MKVTGLDGREYNWNPKSGGGKRSKLHQRAKKVLENCYPYDTILEEVTLEGTQTERSRSKLRGDFYIPNRNLIVEAHGKQHFEFNKFHFKDKLSFYRAQARDRDKKEWCDVNSITIIEFNYDETEYEWTAKITGV